MSASSGSRVFFGVLGCLLLSWVYVGARLPDVNEPHYLTKAKHYWDPTWCARDLFLQSADAHPGFYWALGWISRGLSLSATAWIGRLICWTLLAIAWYRLAEAFDCRWPLLALGLMVCLVERFHLAGEWFLGGMEGKSLAYALVFLGLAHYWDGRWNQAALSLGGALFFHPLVGGWSLLLLMVTHFGHRWLGFPTPSGKAAPLAILAAIAIGAVAVLPLLFMNQSEVVLARESGSVIHVYDRLPHHLVPSHFSWERYASFLGLCTVWLVTARMTWNRSGLRFLHGMALGSLALSLTGFAIDYVAGPQSPSGAAWLRFYWFRMSDILVPLATSLSLLDWIATRENQAAQWSWISLLIAATFCIGGHSLRAWTDGRPAADRQGNFGLGGTDEQARLRYRDWRELCAWIREMTDADVLIVSPLRSQTLKWYAERAEFVTHKDCPQDPHSVQQWWERKELIQNLNLYRPGPRASDQELRRLAKEFGWDYIILLREYDPVARGLPLVFRNRTFELYRFRKPPGSVPDLRGCRRKSGTDHLSSPGAGKAGGTLIGTNLLRNWLEIISRSQPHYREAVPRHSPAGGTLIGT